MASDKYIRCKHCGSIIKAKPAKKAIAAGVLSGEVSGQVEPEEALRKALELSPSDRTFMDLIDELSDYITDDNLDLLAESMQECGISSSDTVGSIDAEELVNTYVSYLYVDDNYDDDFDDTEELNEGGDPFSGVTSSKSTSEKSGLVSWRVSPDVADEFEEFIDEKLSKTGFGNQIEDISVNFSRDGIKVVGDLYVAVSFDSEEDFGDNLPEDVATDAIANTLEGAVFPKFGAIRVLEAFPDEAEEGFANIRIQFTFVDNKRFKKFE